MILTWTGLTCLIVSWTGKRPMFVNPFPVYRQVPLHLEYQFLDNDGQPINLSAYSTFSLLVKNQGEVFTSVPANLDSASNGTVNCDTSFLDLGVWSAQFLAQDLAGNNLYGEIARLTVTPNVDDLALDQLPNY